MHPIRSFRWRIAALLLALASALAGAAGKPPASGPDPKLAPADVVRIQLDALAHVDQPVRDAGLAIVFGFASPGNRGETGPLERFAGMIRRGYPEMLNHRRAVIGEVRLAGKQAGVPVTLIDRAGSAHRYLFMLTQQSDPPYAGCWMTDAVIVDPDQKPAEEA